MSKRDNYPDHMVLLITGLVLIFGGIWGGAVLVHYCAGWLGEAALFTAIALITLGFGLLGLACGDWR